MTLFIEAEWHEWFNIQGVYLFKYEGTEEELKNALDGAPRTIEGLIKAGLTPYKPDYFLGIDCDDLLINIECEQERTIYDLTPEELKTIRGGN